MGLKKDLKALEKRRELGEVSDEEYEKRKNVILEYYEESNEGESKEQSGEYIFGSTQAFNSLTFGNESKPLFEETDYQAANVVQDQDEFELLYAQTKLKKRKWDSRSTFRTIGKFSLWLLMLVAIVAGVYYVQEYQRQVALNEERAKVKQRDEILQKQEELRILENNRRAEADRIKAVKEEYEHKQYLRGKLRETVQIGEQIWMKHNLVVSTFRNGDSIPQAETALEWVAAGEQRQPAWCYYNGEVVSDGVKYQGKLYNWWAVNDYRGLAPVGYHVPRMEEFEILQHNLGFRQMVSISLDDDINEEMIFDGGLNVVRTGMRWFSGGFMKESTDITCWWSSTHYPDGYKCSAPYEECFAPVYISLSETRLSMRFSTNFNLPRKFADEYINNGLAVRCMKGEFDVSSLALIRERLDEIGRTESHLRRMADDASHEKWVREHPETEVNDNEPREYASDGTSCKTCKMGRYSGGFCGMCGGAAADRVSESYSKLAKCNLCNGTGREKNPMTDSTRKCPMCDGKGVVIP